MYSTDSDLGPTAQLYTAKGSQGVGVNKPVIVSTFLDTSDYSSTVVLKTNQVIEQTDKETETDKPSYAFYKRPLWAFKKVPEFVNPDIRDDTTVRSLGIFSIPTYCYLLDMSMDQIDYGTIYIKYKSDIDQKVKSSINKELKKANPNDWGVDITKEKVEEENNIKITDLLDMIFDGCIFIVMFLCFFSLSASTTANLYSQTKEIAVLRSIGLTNWQISRVYFYEAFVVVLSASLLGMLTGSAIGMIMAL